MEINTSRDKPKKLNDDKLLELMKNTGNNHHNHHPKYFCVKCKNKMFDEMITKLNKNNF